MRIPSINLESSSRCLEEIDKEERNQSQRCNQTAKSDIKIPSVNLDSSRGCFEEIDKEERNKSHRCNHAAKSDIESTEIGHYTSEGSIMETDSVEIYPPDRHQNKSKSYVNVTIDAWSSDYTEIDIPTLSNNEKEIDSDDYLFDADDPVTNLSIDFECMKVTKNSNDYSTNYRQTYDGRMGEVKEYYIQTEAPKEAIVCGVFEQETFNNNLSIKDPNVIIWDTAATINLIKNKSFFKGKVKQLTPKDQLEICGFDSSFGFGLATGIGYLKEPMDGVKAYYSENVIGNIVSELKMRELYEAEHISVRNNLWQDSILVKRIGESMSDIDNPTVMRFTRSKEGIQICNLDHDTKIKAGNNNTSPKQAQNNYAEQRVIPTYHLNLSYKEKQIVQVLSRLNSTSIIKVVSKLLETLCKSNAEAVAILKAVQHEPTLEELDSLPGYAGRIWEGISGLRSEICDILDKSLKPSKSIWKVNTTRNENDIATSLINLTITKMEVAIAYYVVIRSMTDSEKIEFVSLTLEQHGLSKKDIANLSIVEQLHKRTSYVSLNTLKLMVRNSTVKGLDVTLTPADVDHYARYVHKASCACTMGKMQNQPKVVLNSTHLEPMVCHCDVMYITTDDETEAANNKDSNKFMFMVGVDAKTQYVIVTRISTASSKEVISAIKQIEQVYNRNGQEFVEIRLDNDPSQKYPNIDKAFTGKLKVQYCTSGRHVNVAEAAIKIIKSLARTTVVDIATSRRFTRQFVPYLIDWVTESLNFSLRSSNDHISPYQQFTGLVVDVNKHFRVAFLEVVAVQDLTKNISNLTARAKVCLVVGREKSLKGGLLVLNTENKQILKRYDFEVLNSKEIYKLVDTRFSGVIVNPIFVFDFEDETDKLSIEEIQALEEKAKNKIKPVYESEGSESPSNNITDISSNNTFEHVPNNTSELPSNSNTITSSTTNIDEEDIPYRSSFLTDNYPPSNEEILATTVASQRSSQYKESNLIHGMRRRSTPKCKVHCLSKEEATTIPQRGDGNCLFYTVSYYLAESHPRDYDLIRDDVYNWMEDNSDTLLGDLTTREWVSLNAMKDLPEYIKVQRENFAWAGELEIQVMARLYNLSIDVYTVRNTSFEHTETYNPTQDGDIGHTKIRIAFMDNNHYEPLILTPKEIKRPVNTRKFTSKLNVKQSNKNNSNNTSSSDKLSSNEELEEPIGDYAAITYSDFTSLQPSNKAIERELRSRLSDKVVDEAIADEINQMHEKGVWEYISPHMVRSVYDCKISILPMQMLLKEKKDANGEFIKVKARVVALGNLQKEVTDTEAPTARLQSFYVLIFIAAKLNISLVTYDVSGAFLNSDLNDTVYVRLNKDITNITIKSAPKLSKFTCDDGTMLAKLRKCLYGLKQSPKRWYDTITEILISLKFTISEHDTCVFFRIENNLRNYLLLFVDDMLVAFEDPKVLNEFTVALTGAFGELSTQSGENISFLGIAINQSKDKITLSQSGYILKMMEKLNLGESIPIHKYPTSSSFSVCNDRYLKSKEEAEPAIAKKMKSLTMSLMYIAMRTRRDVLFHASFFATINCPTQEDIEAVKRVIIYLYNTKDKVQVFYREGSIRIIVFADASHNLFANSTGQNCEIIYLDDISAAVEYSSNREQKVTASACESELIVQNRGLDKGLKLFEVLKELGINVSSPIILNSDNEAAVIIAQRKHINKSGRTKFMNRNLFHINEHVVNGMVIPTWISTDEMDADLGTKPLSGAVFIKFAERQFSRYK